MPRMDLRVVNLKHEECDVRIDRRTPFGNKYIIGRDGSREDVIAKHKVFLGRRPDLVQKLREAIHRFIKGAPVDWDGVVKLGCWCSPEACHGDNYVDALQNGGP